MTIHKKLFSFIKSNIVTNVTPAGTLLGLFLIPLIVSLFYLVGTSIVWAATTVLNGGMYAINSISDWSQIHAWPYELSNLIYNMRMQAENIVPYSPYITYGQEIFLIAKKVMSSQFLNEMAFFLLVDHCVLTGVGLGIAGLFGSWGVCRGAPLWTRALHLLLSHVCWTASLLVLSYGAVTNMPRVYPDGPVLPVVLMANILVIAIPVLIGINYSGNKTFLWGKRNQTTQQIHDAWKHN